MYLIIKVFCPPFWHQVLFELSTKWSEESTSVLLCEKFLLGELHGWEGVACGELDRALLSARHVSWPELSVGVRWFGRNEVGRDSSRSDFADKMWSVIGQTTPFMRLIRIDYQNCRVSNFKNKKKKDKNT